MKRILPDILDVEWRATSVSVLRAAFLLMAPYVYVFDMIEDGILEACRAKSGELKVRQSSVVALLPKKSLDIPPGE